MRALLDKLVPGRRKQPRFSKQEVLGALPVRNSLVEWEVTEAGEVLLKVPRRKDRVGRLLSRFFSAPDFKQIVLDELGSDVWQLCTGDNSVEAIVLAVARKYKLNRREVELSLSNYLKQLASRGLIGLQIAQPVAAPARNGVGARSGKKPKGGRQR